jgi:hypothetical protein
MDAHIHPSPRLLGKDSILSHVRLSPKARPWNAIGAKSCHRLNGYY